MHELLTKVIILGVTGDLSIKTRSTGQIGFKETYQLVECIRDERRRLTFKKSIPVFLRLPHS
jgi:hypothetical protein